MKTTIKIISLIIAAFLVTGCGGVQTPPATTIPQPTPQVEVIHNSISFSLDPALGTEYETMIIAESTGEGQAYFDVYPEYSELSIKNYPLSGTALEPRIYQFPVVRYRQLSPELMPTREADLQSLLSGGPVGGTGLPFLPIFNSAQMFTSQVDIVEFKNGRGVRYITQYSQGIVPINNQEMFYTFQGLTDDGLYWVSVILPISNSILPADGKNPPNGQSMEDFANNYVTYVSDTTAQLNAQGPNSFSPSIPLLDALVNSIVVEP